MSMESSHSGCFLIPQVCGRPCRCVLSSCPFFEMEEVGHKVGTCVVAILGQISLGASFPGTGVTNVPSGNEIISDSEAVTLVVGFYFSMH